MKIVIFAGGHGTRFWPLSRENSPKQFEKIFEGKSTLQMAVERVQEIFGYDNIYISTNEKYKSVLKEQLPHIPEKNFLLEPARKDLAAAIALSFFRIKKSGYNGSIAILWADHLLKKVDEFQKSINSR